MSAKQFLFISAATVVGLIAWGWLAPRISPAKG